jgi:hypothetical protein
MDNSYITLNEASRRSGTDPRQLAALLINAGEKADATLETKEGKQALFLQNRVEELAKSLVEAAKCRK